MSCSAGHLTLFAIVSHEVHVPGVKQVGIVMIWIALENPNDHLFSSRSHVHKPVRRRPVVVAVDFKPRSSTIWSHDD